MPPLSPPGTPPSKPSGQTEAVQTPGDQVDLPQTPTFRGTAERLGADLRKSAPRHYEGVSSPAKGGAKFASAFDQEPRPRQLGRTQAVRDNANPALSNDIQFIPKGSIFYRGDNSATASNVSSMQGRFFTPHFAVAKKITAIWFCNLRFRVNIQTRKSCLF
ncbi:MAG: hypothetical protein R3194_02115 [Limnobacter sp.]|nr:hypothetical protein [Limnobacter sp.]